MRDAVMQAIDLLLCEPSYIEDARANAERGSSIVGQLVAAVCYLPRFRAEAAVIEALRLIGERRMCHGCGD